MVKEKRYKVIRRVKVPVQAASSDSSTSSSVRSGRKVGFTDISGNDQTDEGEARPRGVMFADDTKAGGPLHENDEESTGKKGEEAKGGDVVQRAPSPELPEGEFSFLRFHWGKCYFAARALSLTRRFDALRRVQVLKLHHCWQARNRPWSQPICRKQKESLGGEDEEGGGGEVDGGGKEEAHRRGAQEIERDGDREEGKTKGECMAAGGILSGTTRGFADLTLAHASLPPQTPNPSHPSALEAQY